MKLLALSALLLMAGCLHAQAPPGVLAMNGLPNAGQLYLRFCSGPECVTRKAICYGQCCDQNNADEIGYGCSGDIEGRVPKGYHYAAWFCTYYDSGKTVKATATKNYDMSSWKNDGGCHNLR